MTVKSIIRKLKKEKFSDIQYEEMRNGLDLVIVRPFMSITFNRKKQEALINFDVEVQPDLSAHLALSLKDIKGIKKIYIGDSFMITEKDYLEGEEAIKELEMQRRNRIINDFIKNKIEEGMLRSDYLHEC